MATTKMTKFKDNYAGIGAMLKSDQTRAELTPRAERALAAAKGSAPVATGEYRAGLHLEQVTTRTRAVVRVVGGTDHDLFVEAQTGNLGRAVDHAR
jgi:hypothetical protein